MIELCDINPLTWFTSVYKSSHCSTQNVSLKKFMLVSLCLYGQTHIVIDIVELSPKLLLSIKKIVIIWPGQQFFKIFLC